MCQTKGGCGKSSIILLLMELSRAAGYRVYGYDCDINQKSLYDYSRDKTKFDDALDIYTYETRDVNTGGVSNLSLFNLLPWMMEHLKQKGITAADNDVRVYIDCGASTIADMIGIINQFGVDDLANAFGVGLVLLNLVAADDPAGPEGKQLDKTMDCLDATVEAFPTATHYVVLNNFYGRIFLEGKPFIKSEWYADHKNKIKGVIALPEFVATGGNKSGLMAHCNGDSNRTYQYDIAYPRNPMYGLTLGKYWRHAMAECIKAGYLPGDDED